MKPDASPVAVAARFWDRHHASTQSDRFWMAYPVCRSAINRRVTGNPNEWPLEWFHRRYGPRQHGLSLGCGTGSLERAALTTGLCSSMLGIDVSPRSIELASEHARDAGLADRVTYTVADLNRVRLKKAAFDVVFIHQALHHVTALEKLLARVARTLKPDGVLFVDEWTGPSMTEWTRALLARPAHLYQDLPRAWRRADEFPPPISGHDPTEGIRSSAIMPTLSLLFRTREQRPYGGHLAALLTSQLDPRVDPGPALEEYLTQWLALEDADLAASPKAGYHHVIVAAPRRGIPGFRAQTRAFARRARRGVAYRAIALAHRVLAFAHRVLAPARET